MAPDRRALGAVFAGGFAGTLARAQLAEALQHASATWPWATLVANVAGAFVLGYVATRLRAGALPAAFAGPLLGPGLCGALTTFSTLQLELLAMLDEGRLGLASGYVLVSVAAGLAAVALGTRLARPDPEPA